ncbi:MAG: DUF11 domain-containing protein [Euryarchaeota archaeon]|nr:DUF11 domain-containing protein [Euryarchaeota archaeon]
MRSDVSFKIVMAFLIISGLISPALAYDFNLFQWGEGTSDELMRGEELTYNGYTVKAISFPAPVKSNLYSGTPSEGVNPFVGVNISKNGILITSVLLIQGEYYIVPDGELKVMVKQLPSKEGTEWVYETYAPWAVIEMGPRGTPAIEVSVETDYNEYTSLANTEITTSVTLRNTGSADLLNVNFNVLTSLPIKRGDLKFSYERIRKGESITKSITFGTPMITELKNYEILTNATGYDAKDIFYTAQSTKTILIAPEPEQIPTLRKYVNAKIYLEEYAMVSLTFKNNANYELKNVSITDSLSDGFKLLSNNSLHWIVNIPAKGEWDSRYLVKPLEANKDGAVLPSAIADFRTRREYYSIQSNQPSVVVHGPKISLTKQIDVSDIRPGDTVTVTVVAENTGSTPTKVSISDTLPAEGTLVSGTTFLEEFLEANKATRFSYSLRIDSEQPVKLPAATAEYYELSAKSGKLTAQSGEPEIRIRLLESEQAASAENAAASFEITEVQATPAPTPELPFTPIIYEEEEPVPQETPEQVITPEPVITPVVVSPEEIDSLLNLLLGCNAGSITENGTAIACSIIKKT